MLIVIYGALMAVTPSPSGGSDVSAALAALAGRGGAVQRLARSGTLPTSNYIRLRRTRTAVELQTATVELSLVDEQRGGKPFELGLVSTVHLAEPPYYAALQAEADGAKDADGQRQGGYDRVLFELLADESSVETDASGARRLREPLQAAPALASLAASNRLTTQVGALDCTRDDRWVLADVSRAELAAKQMDADFGAPYADASWRSGLIAPLRNLLGSGPANRVRTVNVRCLLLFSSRDTRVASLLVYPPHILLSPLGSSLPTAPTCTAPPAPPLRPPSAGGRPPTR